MSQTAKRNPDSALVSVLESVVWTPTDCDAAHCARAMRLQIDLLLSIVLPTHALTVSKKQYFHSV